MYLLYGRCAYHSSADRFNDRSIIGKEHIGGDNLHFRRTPHCRLARQRGGGYHLLFGVAKFRRRRVQMLINHDLKAAAFLLLIRVGVARDTPPTAKHLPQSFQPAVAWGYLSGGVTSDRLSLAAGRLNKWHFCRHNLVLGLPILTIVGYRGGSSYQHGVKRPRQHRRLFV
jgi:hypothetical protein